MSSKIKEKSFHKTSKNEKVFSTALLFNMSFFQGSILDNELENQRLNNSSSAIQGDSILNNILSEDLINKIDQLSPIRSNKFEKKMRNICLTNCDGNIVNKENENININIENDKFSSDSSSSDIEIKDNSQIINRKISIEDSLLKSFNNNDIENNISENNLIDNNLCDNNISDNNLREKNLNEKKKIKLNLKRILIIKKI